MKTLHKLSAPYSLTHTIEVYGDPEMGFYEWRVIDEAGHIIRDTGNDHSHGGRGYGSPEIALRDALMVQSGLDDPHLSEMSRAAEESPKP